MREISLSLCLHFRKVRLFPLPKVTMCVNTNTHTHRHARKAEQGDRDDTKFPSGGPSTVSGNSFLVRLMAIEVGLLLITNTFRLIYSSHRSAGWQKDPFPRRVDLDVQVLLVCQILV